jgi:hypothetical protein
MNIVKRPLVFGGLLSPERGAGDENRDQEEKGTCGHFALLIRSTDRLPGSSGELRSYR